MAKKKRKAKLPFWKKHPEIKHIAEHIGKFVDRIEPKDLMDLGVLALVTYAGARTANKLGANLEGQITGAGVGILGYKLATSPGHLSQMSGITILSGMGLCSLGLFGGGHILGFKTPSESQLEWLGSDEGQAAVVAYEALKKKLVQEAFFF